MHFHFKTIPGILKFAHLEFLEGDTPSIKATTCQTVVICMTIVLDILNFVKCFPISVDFDKLSHPHPQTV